MPRRVTNSRGFTLIELMVVIVLLGMATTYGIFKWREYLPRARLEKGARDIGGFLTRLRGMAVFHGRPYYLDYDLDTKNQFRVTRPSTEAEKNEGADEYIEADWLELPPQVQLQRVQFSEDDRDSSRGEIVRVEFSPNGEVTAHIVTLVSLELLGDRGIFTVELNGITGLVSYHSGPKEFTQVRNEFDMR